MANDSGELCKDKGLMNWHSQYNRHINKAITLLATNRKLPIAQILSQLIGCAKCDCTTTAQLRREYSPEWLIFRLSVSAVFLCPCTFLVMLQADNVTAYH